MKHALLPFATIAILCGSSAALETSVHLAPYKNSTRRLLVEVRAGTSAPVVSHSRTKWGRALREAAERDRDLLLTVADECQPELVREFLVAALERYGQDSVRAAEGSPARWTTLATEVQAAHAPLVLHAAPPAEDDLRGRLKVNGELHAPEDREGLLERLREAHATSPERRWVFDFHGLDLAPLAVWQGLPREAGHTRFAMRGLSSAAEPRWMAADREPAIFEITHEGTISRSGDVFTTAKGEPAAFSESERAYADKYFGLYAESPYEAAYMELVRLFEGSAKARIHTRPFIEIAEQRVLLRTHESTPWVHVERLMEIASLTRLPRIDLAVLGRPLTEAEPIDMLVDHDALQQPLDTNGLPVEAEPISVQIEVARPGGRVASTTYSPFDGTLASAWRYDETRRLRFGLENGSADSLAKLTQLFESSKRGGAEFCLVIGCDAGVTVGDVLPLIQTANRMGLTPLSFRMSRQNPSEDYESR